MTNPCILFYGAYEALLLGNACWEICRNSVPLDDKLIFSQPLERIGIRNQVKITTGSFFLLNFTFRTANLHNCMFPLVEAKPDFLLASHALSNNRNF